MFRAAFGGICFGLAVNCLIVDVARLVCAVCVVFGFWFIDSIWGVCFSGGLLGCFWVVVYSGLCCIGLGVCVRCGVV